MLQDGRLNMDTASRCDVALRVVREDPNTIVVLSVDYFIQSLREVTIAYLQNSGLAPERIMTPAEAHDTFGETASALKILRDRGVNEVTVVSSWYHLLRICVIWRYLGFNGKIVPKASFETMNVFGCLAWEIGGFYKFASKILNEKYRHNPGT